MCARNDDTATGGAAATTAPEAATGRARCPNCGGWGSAPSLDEECLRCDGSGHVTARIALEYLVSHLCSIETLLALAGEGGDSCADLLYAAEMLTAGVAVLSAEAGGSLPGSAGAADKVIGEYLRELSFDTPALHAAIWNCQERQDAAGIHAARLIARGASERAEAAEREAARLRCSAAKQAKAAKPLGESA